MKTALFSDLYALRAHGKFYAGYALILVFATLATQSVYMAYYLPCFAAAVAPFTLFPQKEQNGWEQMLLSMPVLRWQVVAARYGILGGITVIGLLFSGVLAAVQGGQPAHVLPLCFALTMLLLAILLPVLFRWGPVVAQFLFFGFFLVLFALVSLLQRFGDTVTGVMQAPGVSCALLLAGVALLGVSYRVSCALYRAKEF